MKSKYVMPKVAVVMLHPSMVMAGTSTPNAQLNTNRSVNPSSFESRGSSGDWDDAE